MKLHLDTNIGYDIGDFCALVMPLGGLASTIPLRAFESPGGPD